VLFFKLIAPIVILISTLVNYLVRDRQNSDRYWKKINIDKTVAIVVFLGSLATGIVIVNEHLSSSTAQNKIDNLGNKLDKAASERDTLLSNLKLLQNNLEPFLREAEFRYPDLNNMDALSKLASNLGQLQLKVDTLQSNYIKDKEKELTQEYLKCTPPKIEAIWEISTSGKHVIEIKSYNNVPFEARWYLANQNGNLLGPLMMGNTQFYPKNSLNRWIDLEMIDSTELIDNYVKFVFKYRSIYYAEMGSPDSLKGNIIHEYRIIDNVPKPWH